jgi:alpha-tubulin suppressor-like RCC1 family protein
MFFCSFFLLSIIVHVLIQISFRSQGEGNVFTWGTGSAGELGHGEDTDSLPAPKIVESLWHTTVHDIAIGGTQSGIVTKEGELFLWGTASGRTFSIPTQINIQVVILIFPFVCI